MFLSVLGVSVPDGSLLRGSCLQLRLLEPLPLKQPLPQGIRKSQYGIWMDFNVIGDALWVRSGNSSQEEKTIKIP